MSNMSYCRFENTAGDLKDCFEQLKCLFNDGEGEPDKMSSEHESAARVRLVELCFRVVELFDDDGELMDTLDRKAKIRSIIDAKEVLWAAEREERCEDEDGEED